MRFTVAAAVLATSAMAAQEVSTDYTTKMITIISCAPEVTNCPADQTSVTSTVLPLTTSTVYSTRLNTVVGCPSNVVKCPAKSTVIETETIAVSTTVCPVTETEATEVPEKTTSVYEVPEETTPTYEVPEETTSVEVPEETTPTYEVPVKTTGENSPETPSETESYKVPVVSITSIPSNGTVPAGSTYVPFATTTLSSPEQCVPSSSVTAITKSYTTVYTSVEYSTIEIPCSSAATETSYIPPVATTPAGGNST